MIKQKLEDFAKSNEKAWEYERSNTVGASEIGQCARKTYFVKNEHDQHYGSERDPDYEDRWGAKVRGSVYEAAWWAPALKAAFGDNLLYAGEDQRTLVSGYLSATPDGLVINQDRGALRSLGVEDINSDCFTVECKTADPRTNLNKPKPENVYQVQVQLGLLRETTNHKPEYGVLTYTDTSFWDEVREFPIRFDPRVYATAQTRAALIMQARSAKDVPPEGVIAGGGECQYCPFTGPCGQARAERVPKEEKGTLTPDQEALVEEWAGVAAYHDAQAKDSARRSKEHKEAIRGILADANTRKARVGNYSISWAALKGRPAYDMKALKAAAEAKGIDISDFETVGDPSDRLQITVRGE